MADYPFYPTDNRQRLRRVPLGQQRYRQKCPEHQNGGGDLLMPSLSGFRPRGGEGRLRFRVPSLQY